MKWAQVRIEDFCSTGSGGTPARNNSGEYYGGLIPWIKSGELRDVRLDSAKEFLSEKGLAESSAKIVQPGAVLVAMYGATVGRTALLEIPAATNQAICFIEPDKDLAIPSFVWYAMRAELPELLRKRVGGAQPNISQAIIRKSVLPLPPLSEQRRIVELLEQADALRRRRADADSRGERILSALFRKMFGEPSQNPNQWPTEALGELGQIVTGSTPSKKRSDFHGGGIPWAKPSDLNSLLVQETGETLTEEGADEARLLPAKSVLVCCIGSLGKVGLAMRAMATNQQINSVIFGPRMLPEYGFEALRLSTAALDAMASKAIVTILNKSRFSTFRLPVPPIPLQQQFAESFWKFWDSRKQAIAAQTAIETLFQTLLHRAFTGELTAGWREAHMRELLVEMEHQTKTLQSLSKVA